MFKYIFTALSWVAARSSCLNNTATILSPFAYIAVKLCGNETSLHIKWIKRSIFKALLHSSVTQILSNAPSLNPVPAVFLLKWNEWCLFTSEKCHGADSTIQRWPDQSFRLISRCVEDIKASDHCDLSPKYCSPVTFYSSMKIQQNIYT